MFAADHLEWNAMDIATSLLSIRGQGTKVWKASPATGDESNLASGALRMYLVSQGSYAPGRQCCGCVPAASCAVSRVAHVQSYGGSLRSSTHH
jgi:hypothetical protein